jgi:hypothetical protein
MFACFGLVLVLALSRREPPIAYLAPASEEEPVRVESLVISPSSTSAIAGDPRAFAVEGFDAFDNSLGDVTPSTTFTIGPDGTCTANSCTATVVSPHTVTATLDTVSTTATVDVTPGPLDRLFVTPSATTITAGATVDYTTDGYDAYDNTLGDVTASATFTISPDGTCTANSCTATVAGPHTVTATLDAISATDTLDITPGPLDHLLVTASATTITAGATVDYTTDGYDAYDNTLGDVTASATFTISPDGTCTANSCTATVVGPHTVTASLDTISTTAALDVTPGPLDHVTLAPAVTSVLAGDSTVHSAAGFDVFGNGLGDVTSSTSFTAAPDGSCAAARCTFTRVGDHVVTGANGSAVGTAAVAVAVGSADHLTIDPPSAVMEAGSSRSFAATTLDPYGNPVADATPSTEFTISPDGSCSGTACTATTAGDHVVTAAPLSLSLSLAGSVNDPVQLAGVRSVQVVGRFAYVAAYNDDRFSIVDVANPAAPVVVGSVRSTELDGARWVAVADQYAYVVTSLSDRLVVIDVGDPAHPSIVTSITSPFFDGGHRVLLAGRYAYITGGLANALSVIDLIDPRAPVIVGSVADSTYLGDPYGVQVLGTVAYVAASASNRFTAVDVSNPTAPTVIGSVTGPLLAGAHGIAFAGHYAFVAASVANSVAVVDIADPAHPTVVGGTASAATLRGAHTPVIVGTYLFMAVQVGDRLTVIDIHDPTNVTIVDSLLDSTRLDGVRSISVQGRYAYLASFFGNRLTVIDLHGYTSASGARPSAPAHATLAVAAGPAARLAISPASGTVKVHEPQSFKAEGFDTFGNDAGDVTGTTAFGIGPTGSCSGNLCTAGSAGSHVVTAANGELRAEASVVAEWAPTFSVGDVTVAEGDAGTASALFTVRLSRAVTETVSLGYSTSGGSATAPTDFTAASGVLVFSPGQVAKTVSIIARGDIVVEGTEGFVLHLTSTSGPPIGRADGIGTILDDDGPPGLSISDVTVPEGDGGAGTAQFTVRLSRPAATTVTVHYASTDGSASAPADFGAASGSLTFSPGQVTKTVAVSVKSDLVGEGDETFAVRLSSAAGAVITKEAGVGGILDDDGPALAIGDVSLPEGDASSDTGVLVVRLARPSAHPVSVDYATVVGSAGAPADFIASAGTLAFSPGQTLKTVAVTVKGDAVQEGDETFNVVLSNAVGSSLHRAVGRVTILDDDPHLGAPTIAVGDATAPETDSASAPMTFTVRLSRPSVDPVSVAYATAPGTAAAGEDFTPASGTVAFSPGQVAKTIAVTTKGDLTDETDEAFSLLLSDPSGAGLSRPSGSGTIIDDDDAPSVSIGDVVMPETFTGGTAVLAVQLSRPSGSALTVGYETRNGTAVAPSDYTAATGSLVFAPGQVSKSIAVTVAGDALGEGDENLTVHLTATGSVRVTRDLGTATIVDDDAPELSVGDVAVVEGDAGTSYASFTVRLSRPSVAPVSVTFGTSAASASTTADFTALSGTVVFQPGQVAKTVSVVVKSDTLDEPDETFELQLTGASAAIVRRSLGTATVIDDD